MKKIVYSQRVEVIENYHERRDCADQMIPRFLKACGYLPIPVYNIPELVDELLEEVQPDGILLTGGNSLKSYGGNAPEKDKTDAMLIHIALEKDIPLYGFCRGMQSILHYFEIPLEEVQNHVAVRHQLLGLKEKRTVNSYHYQGIRNIKVPFEAVAWTEDGIIEEIRHTRKKLIGTMWHPERVTPFDVCDINKVQQFFG